MASSARAAHALDIDEAKGTVHFSDGALGVSLDGPEAPAGVELIVLAPNGDQLDPADRYVAEDLPLEGTGSLAIGGDAPIAVIDVGDAIADWMDRRVEVTLWQKPMGTEANVHIVWSSEMIGLVVLTPTGRATDDGWRELASGPIDLRLAAAMGSPFVLALDAELGPSFEGPLTPDARVHLDALEVRDLGPAAVPDAACTLVNEDDVCGPLGACFYGRCADAAAVVGPNLDAPQVRADYLERLLFLYEAFEGGRTSQAALPGMASALAALADGAPARQTWTGIRAAIETLADAHASPPGTGWRHETNLGVCLHLGEADLLPGGGALPMVFSTSGANPVAELLQPGDVLVEIDGTPVATWLAAATRLIGYSGDPAARAVGVAPQILAAAASTGATLAFARCTNGSSPCLANQIEEVEIDLAALLGTPTLGGSAPPWGQDNAPCDYRFRRWSETDDIAAFAHAYTEEEDGVRIFEFNGFPHPTVAGHAAWMAAAKEAFATAPARAVLDQRTGYGGHPDPVYRLGGYLVAPDEIHRIDFYPWFTGAVDAERLTDLRTCSGFGYYCGGFHSDDIFTAHPAPGASMTSRIAVLLTMDVSGNDFFTKILSYRAAETRLFGPAPTRGGFGEVYPLPAMLGEQSGGRLQVQDSAFSAAPDDPVVFTSSTGVAPQEVVLQKQSDALEGVDTIVQTAMAWVKQ